MPQTRLKPLIHLSQGNKEAKTQVFFDLYALGRDFVLFVSGGEAHIGAVACGLAGQAQEISIAGHKEGELVQEVANALSLVISQRVLVVGGIHYPALDPHQIEVILVHARNLTRQLQEEMAALKLGFELE